MSETHYDINEAEALVAQGTKWVLLPKPIPQLTGPKKRKEFEKAVSDSRYDLIYDKWPDALEAARELSDRGGIETVQIIRVHVKPNVIFKDGKQL